MSVLEYIQFCELKNTETVAYSVQKGFDITMFIISFLLVVLLIFTVVFRKRISTKRYSILITLEILFLVLTTVIGLCLGFFSIGGMGVSNWDCDNLPGKYAIWQISARNTKLVLVNENGVSATDVVPTYVFEVGYTDTYIFAKQVNVPEDYNKRIDKSIPNYYIVVVESGEIFGPYNEQEFFECLQQFGIEEPIHWMSLDTLRKTPFERDEG